jgi:hypothetical protein
VDPVVSGEKLSLSMGMGLKRKEEIIKGCIRQVPVPAILIDNSCVHYTVVKHTKTLVIRYVMPLGGDYPNNSKHKEKVHEG